MKPHLFALIVALAAPVAMAQVYKWVDDKGHVQYGDKPPPGAKATPVAPPPGPQAKPRPAEDLATQDAEFKRREIRRREEEEKLAREEKLRQQRCDQAKDRLAFAELARQRFRIENGERVYLSDAERAVEIDKLNALVAKHCR